MVTTATFDTDLRIEQAGEVIGLREEEAEAHGWMDYIVKRRFNRARAKARAKREGGMYAMAVPHERAESITRWACVKAAISGVASGLVTSGAAFATAETGGVGGLVAIPFGAAAIGIEMATRTVFHVDLACELAEVYSLPLNHGHETSRLIALALGAAERDDDELGERKMKAIVEKEKAGELVERAGKLVLGESVLRNVVPVVGILSSAITNVLVTYRLGNRLRRSFGSERVMLDAIREAQSGPCMGSMDLLIEGLWFVFTADGMLGSEETACLVYRMDTRSPLQRKEIIARFTGDPHDWLERVTAVPEDARDAFLHVLHVGAMMSGTVNPLEEQLVRRVAEVFSRTYDPSTHAAAPAREEAHA